MERMLQHFFFACSAVELDARLNMTAIGPEQTEAVRPARRFRSRGCASHRGLPHLLADYMTAWELRARERLESGSGGKAD